MCQECSQGGITEHLNPGDSQAQQEERLVSKQEMSEELNVSLVTLTDWMKKGLPFMRLHRRVYFKKSEVLKSMQEKTKDKGAKHER